MSSNHEDTDDEDQESMKSSDTYDNTKLPRITDWFCEQTHDSDTTDGFMDASDDQDSSDCDHSYATKSDVEQGMYLIIKQILIYYEQMS